jgi:hypothetical protein
MTWLQKSSGEKVKTVGLQVEFADSGDIHHYHKNCFLVIRNGLPDNHDSVVLTSDDIKDSPCACDHCGEEIVVE